MERNNQQRTRHLLLNNNSIVFEKPLGKVNKVCMYVCMIILGGIYRLSVKARGAEQTSEKQIP